jgi:signal transduction histidine kinase
MVRDLTRYSEHLEELVEERTRELRDAERMAAIGETAAMVGHDLRNPMQTLVSTIYLAKKKLRSLPSPPAEKQDVIKSYKLIEEQVWYINRMISELADYARPVKPKLASTSLPPLIDDTLSTVTVPENVKVSIKVKRGLKAIVDPVLMKRVLINLVANALHAMPDGGRLTITASKKAKAVVIRVEDTGVGIPKKGIDNLFKPFPTTKPGGTGLGLVICKRLVEAHGGTITVKSKVGKGSTFTIKILQQKRG